MSQGSEDPPSVIDEVRADLILDDDFFQIVNNIDFQKDTMEMLFSYPDILAYKDDFDDYHIYLFSFLANYLIFMYDYQAGTNRISDFEYPLLQVLTIQIKNLVDYTYVVAQEAKPYLRPKPEVAKKLVACISILIDKMEDNCKDDKILRYLHFCDPGSWNKIINALDVVYQNDLDFLDDLINLVGKLYLPRYLAVDTEESESTFDEFLTILVTVLNRSSDIKALIATVDVIINIFSEDHLDNFMIKHNLFRLLKGGQAAFNEQTSQYIRQLKENGASEEVVNFVGEVQINLDAFLLYKLENIQF